MGYTITARYHRTLLGSMLLGLCALLSQGASATLMNADFSAGFTGWSGEIATYEDYLFAPDVDNGIGPATAPLEVTYPANYLLPGGGAAKISTSQVVIIEGLLDTYFVSLFQNFTVDSIAPGSTLELSLGVVAALTDAFNGAVQLIDTGGGLAALDLTGGGTFDITAWAGAGAQFALFVEDSDFDLPTTDMITVSGITFTETPASVMPVPGSALLLGLGLLGLWGSRRLTRVA